MKKGTLIIKRIENRSIAYVRRADGAEIQLDIQVTPDIQKLNGKGCEYLLSKGDKIVMVDDVNIYQQKAKEYEQPEKKVKKGLADFKIRTQVQNKQSVDLVDANKLPMPNLEDSFDVSKSCVPIDTREALKKENNHSNFYLKLNQFARFDFKDNKEDEKHFTFFNLRPIKAKKTNSNPNPKTVVPAIQIKPEFGNLFNSPNLLASRLSNSAEKIFFSTGELLKLNFKPEWRFVTGLGGYSIYETGITLHHIYGIPYIPASTIKGVLRSWIVYSQFNNNEGQAIQDKGFCKVFGCPPKIKIGSTNYESYFKKAIKGKVNFFDAFPLSKPIIEPDIMNPHYPAWYSSDSTSAPVDTDSPTPIFFLTIKETPFQFLLGSKKFNIEAEPFWNGQTLGWWLENALSEHGIGAKTAVGYGYMKKI